MHSNDNTTWWNVLAMGQKQREKERADHPHWQISRTPEGAPLATATGGAD